VQTYGTVAIAIPFIIAFSFVLAAPTAIARRGLGPYLLVAAVVSAGGIAAHMGAWLVDALPPASDRIYDKATIRYITMMAGTSAAAIGVAEALYEKSAAATFCGLFGSILAGITTPLLLLWPLKPGFINDWNAAHAVLMTFVFGPSICNIGIGLSLALGRYIRDLPKKGGASAGGGPAVPADQTGQRKKNDFSNNPGRPPSLDTATRKN
jgi:hypothetical protein